MHCKKNYEVLARFFSQTRDNTLFNKYKSNNINKSHVWQYNKLVKVKGREKGRKENALKVVN